MNKEYQYYLIKYPNHKKKVTVRAKDYFHASDIIGRNFPDWQVSMFWVKWPFIYSSLEGIKNERKKNETI